MRKVRVATLLAVLVVAGGLVASQSSGQSATGGQGVAVPAQVRTILDDNCVKCHGGGNPSANLNLSTNGDVLALVGEPSIEKRSIPFIDPGKPGDSYLYLKVEGSGRIIGGRMPLTGGHLSQQQLDAVHGWIAGMPASAGSGSQAHGSAGSSSGSEAPSATTVDRLFDASYAYQLRCSSCHGRSGEGVSLFGPPLAGDAFIMTSSDRAIGDVVHMGRKYRDKHYPAYSGMPRFQFITGGELQSLVDYLKGPLQAGHAASAQ